MNDQWNLFNKVCKKAKKSATNVGLNVGQKIKARNVERSHNSKAVLTPETILKEYELYSNICQGGYANVYSAKRKSDGMPVALKVLEKIKVGSFVEENSKQMPKEVFLHKRLNHENIIKLLGYFECGQSVIMVLERPELHIDLFDFISKQEFLSENIARKIFRQVLDATVYCETKGVFHRDIKDENIVLDMKTGEAKLIDFGSGTELTDSVYTEYEDGLIQTQWEVTRVKKSLKTTSRMQEVFKLFSTLATFQVFGSCRPSTWKPLSTRSYCPPEWYINQRYRAKPATVWSLGILLYDMVCGDVPFPNEQDIMTKELSFTMSLSQDLQDLMKWMLQKDAEKRPTINDIMNHKWMKNQNTKEE